MAPICQTNTPDLDMPKVGVKNSDLDPNLVAHDDIGLPCPSFRLNKAYAQVKYP